MTDNRMIAHRIDHELIIQLGRRFAHHDNKQLQGIYQDHSDVKSIILDFQDVDSVDSGALGVLLLLRSWAGHERANITIRHPRKTVRELLQVAHFDQLFKIE